MDKLEAMKVFVRVAQTSSFTRAADDLALPRATVSAAVQQLEGSVGTRLLHRSTRNVQLTQDGAALLERCINVLQEVAEMESLFGAAQHNVRGRVKLEAPSRLARLRIAPQLPALLARYPLLEIELGANDRFADIVQEGVDIALRVGQIADSSLVAKPLASFSQINCASPAYLAQYGVPQHPADLAAHRAVNYASPSTGRILPWQYRENGVLHSVQMAGSVVVNNAETYISCALAGLGLIQIPRYGAEAYLESGELVAVLSDWPDDPMPVTALYSHRRHVSPKIRAVVDWLADLLRDAT